MCQKESRKICIESTHVRQCGSVPKKSGGRLSRVQAGKDTDGRYIGALARRPWVAHFTSLRATVPQDTNMQRA